MLISLAQRLMLSCAHSGMTVAALAERVGVTPGFISAVKLGKSKGLKCLPMVATVLGVDRDWLVEGRGDGPDWAQGAAAIPGRRSRRSVPWTPSTRAQLGKIPDVNLARQLGVSIHLVIVERRRQGIAPSRPAPPITWTAEMLAALGKVPDAQLAAKWGISNGAVALRRQARGIPPAQRRHPTLTPTQERDIRCLTVRAFVARYGIPESWVRIERRRRGVNGVVQRSGVSERRSHPGLPWTPATRAQLGRIPDDDLARQLGVPSRWVADERRRQRLPSPRPAQAIQWSAAMLADLGKRPDAQLAAEWGISSTSVYIKRHERGLPPARQLSHVAGETLTAEQVLDLGRLSCRAFAAAHGITPNQVLVERRRRGIVGAHVRTAGIPELLQEQLGTMSDRDFAARWGYTAQYVGCFRVRAGIMSHRQRLLAFDWTPHRIRCLGKVADRQLGRRWGIHPGAVTKKRQELGIVIATPHVRWTAEMREAVLRRPVRDVISLYHLTEGQVRGMRSRLGMQSPRRGRRYTPDEDALLGTAPDSAVARRLGRHHTTVSHRRRLLKILAWRFGRPRNSGVRHG